MTLDCHCGNYGHSWDCGYHSHWREEALERKKAEEQKFKDDHPPGWLMKEANRARIRVNTREIAEQIASERIRQQDKWGEQNHPDFDQVLLNRPGGVTRERLAEEYHMPSAALARSVCDLHHKRGDGTWAHILVEEVAEVIDTRGDDPEELRAELIQVAAVAVAWIEAIDRRQDN